MSIQVAFSRYRTWQLVWSLALVITNTSGHSSWLATSPSATNLQDGSEGVEVSARQSAIHLADLCMSTAATVGRRQSRSAVSGTLMVSWTRTSTGQCSFADYGPRTWNRLLPALWLVRSVAIFIQAPAQDPHGSSSTSVLDAVVTCTYCCPALLWLLWVWRRLQMSRLNSSVNLSHSHLVTREHTTKPSAITTANMPDSEHLETVLEKTM